MAGWRLRVEFWRRKALTEHCRSKFHSSIAICSCAFHLFSMCRRHNIGAARESVACANFDDLLSCRRSSRWLSCGIPDQSASEHCVCDAHYHHILQRHRNAASPRIVHHSRRPVAPRCTRRSEPRRLVLISMQYHAVHRHVEQCRLAAQVAHHRLRPCGTRTVPSMAAAAATAAAMAAAHLRRQAQYARMPDTR